MCSELTFWYLLPSLEVSTRILRSQTHKVKNKLPCKSGAIGQKVCIKSVVCLREQPIFRKQFKKMLPVERTASVKLYARTNLQLILE